jgi:hypothetical protein
MNKTDWHDFFEHKETEIAPERGPRDFLDTADFVDPFDEPERPAEHEREREPELGQRRSYAEPGSIDGRP